MPSEWSPKRLGISPPVPTVRIFTGQELCKTSYWIVLCLRYEGQTAPAIDNVSVDIMPGQLVLIVGSSGSGKSSLLKLLARLVEPTAGEIFIDDNHISDYELETIRDSMTFLSQTDSVYPLSIRENLLMGLPYARVNQNILDKAADAGGCLSLLLNRGNAVIDPPRIVSQSFNQGPIGNAAHAYLQKQENQARPVISLSEGEKQRVVA
ncbi:hypothetical protein H0H81_005459 [Sphagnurus paluster]|uniref:ABC transporter domain-containing protein n=1 Tax=Sphagnurus paluster TaxID=117069 RepID=A0A9P7GM41_9AGAR|nr:hypothetical protein H0H81_005459 [Sphagnurus paluster]